MYHKITFKKQIKYWNISRWYLYIDKIRCNDEYVFSTSTGYYYIYYKRTVAKDNKSNLCFKNLIDAKKYLANLYGERNK